MEFEKGFNSNFNQIGIKSIDIMDDVTYQPINRENIQSFFDGIFEKHSKNIKETNIDYHLYIDESHDAYDESVSIYMYITKYETEEERLVRYEKWLKNKETREAKKAKQKEEKLIKAKQKEDLERQKRYEEYMKLKQEFGE